MKTVLTNLNVCIVKHVNGEHGGVSTALRTPTPGGIELGFSSCSTSGSFGGAIQASHSYLGLVCLLVFEIYIYITSFDKLHFHSNRGQSTKDILKLKSSFCKFLFRITSNEKCFQTQIQVL